MQAKSSAKDAASSGSRKIKQLGRNVSNTNTNNATNSLNRATNKVSNKIDQVGAREVTQIYNNTATLVFDCQPCDRTCGEFNDTALSCACSLFHVSLVCRPPAK